MKKQPTYGEKQRAYAQLLIEQGVPYDEILKDSSLKGFKRGTLRTMRSRHEAKMNATKTGKNVTPETTMKRTETQATDNEEQKKQPEKAGFIREFARAFHPADLLYYGCVSISGIGIIQALHVIGYVVSAVFFSVAVLALFFVKVRNGWARVPHLLALALVECGVFVSDFYWSNALLWANVKTLPINIWVEKYRNGAGEVVEFYAGPGAEIPSYIAAGVATVMLFCGVYVVAIAIQNSIKKA